MGTPFSPFWFRNMFDPYKMQGMMAPQQPSLKPFDPEEEDWIRFGRQQPAPQQPTAPAPGVPNVLNATPITPPKPMPQEKVKYGPTEYDPSLVYPSPTGETALNFDPTVKPPFPRSPQSKPTAATGKYPQRIKPMRSSQDLYPERIDEPVDTSPTPGLRRGNEPPDHVPSYWYGYPEQYTKDLPSATQNPPNNFMGQPYVGAGNSEEAQAKEINNALQYVPKHEWSDRLIAMLDNMPQRNQDMSKWRKFGSFLTGFGLGPEAQEKATYAPYYRDVADWKLRLDPTLKGAEMERQENINLRQLVSQENAQRIQDKRADAYWFGQKSQADKREADIARDQAKNRITERALGDKNWTWHTSKENGHVIGIHPTQGVWDTGVPANEATPEQKHLWDLDKIREAGNQRRLSQAAAARLGRPGDIQIFKAADPNTGIETWMVFNKATRTATKMRESGADELEVDEQGASDTPPPSGAPPQQPAIPHYNPATGGTPPGSKPIAAAPQSRVVEEQPTEEEPGGIIAGGPSGTQSEHIRKVRASQIKSRLPKDLGRWIQTDRNTGLPYVTRPSSFMGMATGPTQEVSDMLNDMLDGKIPIGSNATPVARPPGATNRGNMRILGSGKKVWVEP